MQKTAYFLKVSFILVALIATAGVPPSGAFATSRAASAPPLGAAASFSVLAALSMSAAGAGTVVSGDLGLSPGLAVSRTGPWTVGGTEYFGPLSLAATAQANALTAFNDLAGQGSDGAWSASPWSPVPGVWTAASDTTFAGTITLNGGYNDVWVFQVGRDMTFSGSVIMAGNAQPCNVFWQIGRDATIAVGSTFVGTLIASRDVTLVSGATVDGRIISLNSSLTTDGNTISGPIGAATPTPTETPTLTPLPTPTGTPSPAPSSMPTPPPAGGSSPPKQEPWTSVVLLVVIVLGRIVWRTRRNVWSSSAPPPTGP